MKPVLRAAAWVAAATGAGLVWWLMTRDVPVIDPADGRQIALGRAHYAAHCAGCHGERLEGDPDGPTRRKPGGARPAPPLDAGGQAWGRSDQYLFAVTKHGMARFVTPETPSAMPSFVGILSDAEIRAVLSFIESTWPPETRERHAALSRH
jgi:mono/diheme cytochrome c family protein